MSKKDIETIIQNFEYRAKWYFQDFGGLLCGHIRLYAEIYSDEQSKHSKQTIVKGLKKIYELYDKIPQEDLEQHPDKDIFIYHKEYLPILEREINKLFSGNKYTETKIHTLIGNLSNVGRKYHTRLSKMQKTIRNIPGHEQYTYKTIGIDGTIWKNTFLEI